MKKLLPIIMTICLSVSSSFSQLPNGSIAPDWTLTDLNGTTHNLYSYLDNGYTVFIDFSAVWCPPCWSYHTSGALEDLYINHGPDGMPNVSSTTTDDVMVFFIEGDQGTVAELNGTGSNTQGNWVAGTPYPIFCTDGTVNTNAVTSAYSIGYWPTLYRICPDRICDEVGQPSNPYSLVSSCPPPTTNTNDVRAMTYEGGTETCLGDLTPEIKVQNYGLNALTSFDIEVLVNGTQNSITPWTGNLTTYQLTSITLPTITGITGTSQIEIKTTNPNGGPDDDMSNNDISFTATLSYQTAHIDVTVNITTDQYPDETTWDIKTISGLTVANNVEDEPVDQYNTYVNASLTVSSMTVSLIAAWIKKQMFIERINETDKYLLNINALCEELEIQFALLNRDRIKYDDFKKKYIPLITQYLSTNPLIPPKEWKECIRDITLQYPELINPDNSEENKLWPWFGDYVLDTDDYGKKSVVRNPTTFMEHFKKSQADRLRSSCCASICKPKAVTNIY